MDTTCDFGQCENPAIFRAWFKWSACGHLYQIFYICDQHPSVADSPTPCLADDDGVQCGQVSRIKVTKRKALK